MCAHVLAEQAAAWQADREAPAGSARVALILAGRLAELAPAETAGADPASAAALAREP
jgi:hypothetical protein